MCDNLGVSESVRQSGDDRQLDTRCCVKQRLEVRGVNRHDVDEAELVCDRGSCSAAHEAIGRQPGRAGDERVRVV